MAETEARPRDWFAPLMTLATVVVAISSLHYSSVQADISRKTFEMTCNAARPASRRKSPRSEAGCIQCIGP